MAMNLAEMLVQKLEPLFGDEEEEPLAANGVNNVNVPLTAVAGTIACGLCGQICKGNSGLSTHMRKHKRKTTKKQRAAKERAVKKMRQSPAPAAKKPTKRTVAAKQQHNQQPNGNGMAADGNVVDGEIVLVETTPATKAWSDVTTFAAMVNAAASASASMITFENVTIGSISIGKITVERGARTVAGAD